MLNNNYFPDRTCHLEYDRSVIGVTSTRSMSDYYD